MGWTKIDFSLHYFDTFRASIARSCHDVVFCPLLPPESSPLVCFKPMAIKVVG